MAAPAPPGGEPAAGAAVTAEAGGPGAPAASRAARLMGAVGRLLRRRQFWAGAVLLGLVGGGLAWGVPQLRAWYHFRAAASELRRYHNPQAIRHLHECLRAWPADPDVLLLAARAARRGRSYAEAERLLESYQRARGLDEACTLEQLLLSAERRVEQVAEACWRQVEQGHPDTPLILEALARGYMRQYRLVEARRCLDRWLQAEPDNPQALCLDGLFHLDYEHARSPAERSYARAVEVDPENEEARQGLAVVLIDAARPADAAEQLEYLRRCQPDNFSAQVGLAECRNALGDSAEAVRLVDAVLARQPQFGPALSLRGRLAMQDGQHEAAEAWLRQAVAQSPGDHRALYNLARCLRENGKAEEANERQQELEQREKDLKRFDEIISKEMVQRPRDPALHCTLGQLLLRGGYREEGLYWLHSALRLDPQYAPARQALESYYQGAPAEPPP
jgi:tetratricopeptide (TPR) repeat protein